MPAMNPSAGLLGVEGVLVVTSSPESSSKATTSVKVPPVSMPMRILRVMATSLAGGVGKRRRQHLPKRTLAPLFYPRVVDLSVIVRGTDPPGRTFASYGDVHVGVQVGREAVGLVPADTAAPEWALDVRYDGDFRGPAVHGKKGDRFLYVCWVDRVGGIDPRVPPRQADARPDRPGRGRVRCREWPHAGRHGVADRREGRAAVRALRPAGDRLDGRVSQLSFARSL